MISQKWEKVLALLLLVSFAFTGCTSTGVESETYYGTEAEVQKVQIANIDEAYDVILSSSTREFIGGYPIDESFLSFVGSTYGSDAVTTIAEAGNYSDPKIWYQVIGKSIHVLWHEYCKAYGMYQDEDIYEITAASEDVTVLDFAGDFSMADNVATTSYMNRRENGLIECFSEDLLSEMTAADLMVVNNEFCYTSRGTAIPGKAYTFRGNPSYVSYLSEIGVDLVSLANNHVYDYGEIGLLDTLDTLSDAGMPYVGAGRNLSEAMRPVYYIINGRKIAIVSATQVERSYNYTKEATENTAGVLKTLISDKFCSEIAEAKSNADIVIAIVHWGTEGNASYGADQFSLAEDFVEAGADAIIGGHTHCLQSVEYMGDVPIFYSLGNYWFATSSNMPKDYDTGLAQIRIDSDGNISPYFIPCSFSYGVTSIAEGEKRDSIMERMRSYASTTELLEDGLVRPKNQ